MLKALPYGHLKRNFLNCLPYVIYILCSKENMLYFCVNNPLWAKGLLV